MKRFVIAVIAVLVAVGPSGYSATIPGWVSQPSIGGPGIAWDGQANKLAIDCRKGDIYVLENYGYGPLKNIHHFAGNGEYLGVALSGYGDNGGPSEHFIDLTVAPDRSLCVLESPLDRRLIDRVWVLPDRGERYSFEIDDQNQQLEGIVADKNCIMVGGKTMVAQYDYDGQLLRTWPVPWQSIAKSQAFCLDGHYLYISGGWPKEIRQYTLAGRLVRSWKATPAQNVIFNGESKGLAVYCNRVYVVVGSLTPSLFSWDLTLTNMVRHDDVSPDLGWPGRIGFFRNKMFIASEDNWIRVWQARRGR